MGRRSYLAVVVPSPDHRVASEYLATLAAHAQERNPRARVLAVQMLALTFIETLVLLDDLDVEGVWVGCDLRCEGMSEQRSAWKQGIRALGIAVEDMNLAIYAPDAWAEFVRDVHLLDEEAL